MNLTIVFLIEILPGEKRKTYSLFCRLGEDSCHVQPFTDSYNYTLAYLLIWDIMLCLCEEASIELKFQYADWLRYAMYSYLFILYF